MRQRVIIVLTDGLRPDADRDVVLRRPHPAGYDGQVLAEAFQEATALEAAS